MVVEGEVRRLVKRKEVYRQYPVGLSPDPTGRRRTTEKFDRSVSHSDRFGFRGRQSNPTGTNRNVEQCDPWHRVPGPTLVTNCECSALRKEGLVRSVEELPFVFSTDGTLKEILTRR